MASGELDLDRAIDVGYFKTAYKPKGGTFDGKPCAVRLTHSAFDGTDAWVDAITRAGLDGRKLRVMLVPEAGS
jgi:hypothetical protein